MDLNSTIQVFNSIVNTSQVIMETKLVHIKLILIQAADTGKIYTLSKLHEFREYIWMSLQEALPLIVAILKYILFKLADMLVILLVKWKSHLLVGTAIFLGTVYLWYQNANKTQYQMQALEQCYLELAILISSKDCHPILLRLAWSDAASYDQSIREWPRCGGTNASIRFDRNLSHPSNAGLAKALQYLRPLKKKYRNISWSDLIQMAGSLAVELAGGPSMQGKMKYGRIDAPIPPKIDSQQPSPNANKLLNYNSNSYSVNNQSSSSTTTGSYYPSTSRSTMGPGQNNVPKTSSISRNLRDSASSGIQTSRSVGIPNESDNYNNNNNNISNYSVDGSSGINPSTATATAISTSNDRYLSRIHKHNSQQPPHSDTANIRTSHINNVRSSLFSSEHSLDSFPPPTTTTTTSTNGNNNNAVRDQNTPLIIPKLPLPLLPSSTHAHAIHSSNNSNNSNNHNQDTVAHGVATGNNTDTARSSYSVLSQYTSARSATSYTDHHTIKGGIGSGLGLGPGLTKTKGYGKDKNGSNNNGEVGDKSFSQCEASRLPVAEPPYPDGVPTADAHIRHVFYRMGFKNKEIVALCGAHTLGRAFKDRSGVCEFASGDATTTKYTNQNWCAKGNGKPGVGMAGGCSWTKNWLQFDNSYFQRIHDVLNESHEKNETDKDDTGSGGSGNDLLWLSTDMALYKSSEFRPYFMRYLNDEKAFFEDYADAHKKMSELGSKFHPIGGITLSHIDITKYINK